MLPLAALGTLFLLQPVTAVVHVRLIDGRGGPPIENATVRHRSWFRPFMSITHHSRALAMVDSIVAWEYHRPATITPVRTRKFSSDANGSPPTS